MKSLLFSAVVILSLNALAQQNVSIRHSISDDGTSLSIKIMGTANGKTVDYNRVFDVTGMSTAQKNALKERVYDSLGLPAPTPPHAPIAPHEPTVPREPIAPTPPQEPNTPEISSASGHNELYAIGGDHPYTKEIRYNPETGLLVMKYRFVKNKQEISMEKSIEAKGKSKEERDELIKKYEKEIGIAKPVII